MPAFKSMLTKEGKEYLNVPSGSVFCAGWWQDATQGQHTSLAAFCNSFPVPLSAVFLGKESSVRAWHLQ